MIIKINLALKKSSIGSSVPVTSTSGLQGLLSKFKLSQGKSITLTTETKTLVIQISLLLLVAYLGNYYVTDYKQKQMDVLAATQSDIQSKLKLIESEISKTAGYEKLKKDLESDEQLVRKKIETIQKVITNRSDGPQILLKLSEVIPKNVWLTDLQLNEKLMKVNGVAISFEDYADFSKKLEGVQFFNKVTTTGGISQTVLDGVPVYRFGLDMVRR